MLCSPILPVTLLTAVEFLTCLSWPEERICLYRSRMNMSSGCFGEEGFFFPSGHTPVRAGQEETQAIL